ncbi:MAG: hypothetical protein PHH85_01620 [Candidatus Methanoperedens sp.]|nr:hypothetical protein [Candidatus Methanoperedens sp.]
MGNTAEGTVRIVMQDASGTSRSVVFGEVRTEPLRAAAAGTVATDPRTMLQVPAGAATLGQDDKLVVEMKADSATNINNTSTIRIPVRIQNVKTGVVRETYLTGADLGLTSSNVAIATTFTTVGSYTVNAQERVRLGHTTQVNSQALACLLYT